MQIREFCNPFSFTFFYIEEKDDIVIIKRIDTMKMKRMPGILMAMILFHTQQC